MAGTPKGTSKLLTSTYTAERLRQDLERLPQTEADLARRRKTIGAGASLPDARRRP